MSDGEVLQAEGREAGVLVAGRYRLERLLARGGMGEVHAAFDESAGRRVALKRLLPEVLESRDATLGFTREYHVLAGLRHPRIIEVFDCGVDHGLPYYTMELLDGQDLRELAPLPVQTACSYLRDMASSLALLHARRLLHRDVSPRNVRRTSDGRCKLLDFGTMVPFGLPPNVAGTPPFVPPEALRRTPLDPRSDLYALGALGYYLLTGRNAYQATTLEELPAVHRKGLTRPSRLVPDIPTALEDLILSLMALDPARRPRSAAEVIDLLGAIGELPQDESAGVVQSFLTGTQLVGREAQRSRVARRLERARAGQGSTLLLYGEPGSGRTRMLEETVHMAQTRGFVAVHATARGARGTQALSESLALALAQRAPEESARVLRAASGNAAVGATTRRADQAPTGEARVRAQSDLTRRFCDVARQRPLLVAIDDIEEADQFSIAFAASLAHEARNLPLLIVASRTRDRVDEAFSSLAALSAGAGKMTISALDRPQSDALVASMFGEVPNIQRLQEWLYRAAHGNPALTVELSKHLVSRKVVRYLEGTWVLPSDAITEAVPPDLTQTLGLRLLHLQPNARALAELMSVRRGGLNSALAAAAGQLDPDDLFAAFGELVAEGVVEMVDDDYVFAQRAMRDAVRSGLTPQREAELHGMLARALLRDEDSDARLEAGWHLVHTEDELQGADLLASVGPRLVADGMSIATALPAIERALEVYERRGRPLAERLRLRSCLVLSGYLFDYRLGLRYGKETLDALYRCTGLALATRLRAYLGGPIAFVVSFVVTSIKRYFVPKRNRGPHVVAALQYFGRSVMGLMGLRATALDGPGTQELRTKATQLALLPPPFAVATVARAAAAFALQPLGREGDLSEAIAAALETLMDRRPVLLQETERQDLLTGLLLMDGINECYREHSNALDRAARLDALGTLLATASAQRVRMIYYTVRGERELADRARRALDLHAIQGGTTWQLEWFAVPVEGLAGALLGDLLAIRRALDKLDTMISYVPSLEPLRDAVRIGYHYRRGRFEKAVELGERFMAHHAPRTVIGWGPAYALVALSMIETGRAARALEVCDAALEVLPERDYPYYVMYAPIVLAQAMAHATLGNHDRADQLLRSYTARLAAAGEHSALAVVHEQRARVARRAGDRRGLQDAVVNLRVEALATGNPALIAVADHWNELFERLARNSTAPPSSPLDDTSSDRTVLDRSEGDHEERTVVTSFLLASAGPERARRALEMLAQAVGSAEGYIFTVAGGALDLAASLDGRDPPDGLDAPLMALLPEIRAPGQYVIHLTEQSSPSPEVPPGSRFCVLALAGFDGSFCSAMVALLEGEDPLDAPRPALLEEIGRLLDPSWERTAVDALDSGSAETTRLM